MPDLVDRPLRVLLVLAAFASAAPRGGVPLARGAVWTDGGIGATSLGGFAGGGDEPTMLRMEGMGWYHYRPWLIAGAAYNLSRSSTSDGASVFVTRYEIHTSMVWPLGEDGALQIDLPLHWGKKDFYVDTVAGRDPVLKSSQFVGSGLLGSIGVRKGLLGASLSGGCIWGKWLGIDSARAIDLSFELEPAVSMGLWRLWPRSDSLTRAWDLVVKLPVQYTPVRTELARAQGRSYEADSWQLGVRVGLAIVL